MSHLDRPARRALCLHSEGAAAPLATHRTQAPAARKRGGGAAHSYSVSAMPHGRQPLPEGGEIDSLCRAAAGIIPLITPLISAHNGAHAYPTEGVRRAQKPLCSFTEYKVRKLDTAPTCTSSENSLHCRMLPDKLNDTFPNLAVMGAGLSFPLHDLISIKRHSISQTRSNGIRGEIGRSFKSEKAICNFLRVQLGEVDRLKVPQRELKQRSMVFKHCWLWSALDNVFTGLRDSYERICGYIRSLGHVLVSLNKLLGPPTSTLPLSNPNGSCDCTNTPYCLHPSGGIFAIPRQCKHAEDENHNNWAYQQLKNIRQRKPDVKLMVHKWLLAIKNCARLPAASPQVHGGTA